MPEGEVDSWEDIAADDPKPSPPSTVSGNTPSSSTSTQDIISSAGEPTTTTNSDATIPEPSKEPTSSPNNQKGDVPPSNEHLSIKPEGSRTSETIISDSELKPKEQQGDHSSPSTTPVPKTKVIAAPQRTENDKENVNIVFIGHVDAGKSTIGGHVMLVVFCVLILEFNCEQLCKVVSLVNKLRLYIVKFYFIDGFLIF